MRGKSFQKDLLNPTRWKNGGGVTREIATSLNGRPYWRMSIADVERNGAFSQFPGCHRILTVIAGEGMQLDGAERTISAVPQVPVRFDGSDQIDGKLLDGPVQNFNLIFDPLALRAQVIVGTVASLCQAIQTDVDIAMIYCLTGALNTTDSQLIQEDCGAFIDNPIGFHATGGTDLGLWIGLREITALIGPSAAQITIRCPTNCCGSHPPIVCA